MAVTLKKKVHGDTWHDREIDEVLSQLNSSTAGLSEEDVKARLLSYGHNQLPEPKRRGLVKRFLLQFHNILIYVLMGAAIITAGLDHWVDTFVILAVVLVNAAIGLIQEGKAEKALDAIRQMLAPKASVIRNGKRQTVAGETLVPGDIVLLDSGGKVPADIRLIEVHGLSIQEAILTGESVPIEKRVEAVNLNSALGDRFCMAYSGTLVTRGQGRGVVVATGTNTEIGRISTMLSEVEVLTTPLVSQMSVFAHWLTALILLVSFLLFAFGYFVQHHNFTDLLMVVVGLFVAAIPEGLPAVLTITLAIGVQAMARRNVIVRRLPAIETLGSVSVICTDKTGTLTLNEMVVTSVTMSEGIYAVDGTGYQAEGNIKFNDRHIRGLDSPNLEELARAAVLCNDAELRHANGTWTVEGDPMEGALLSFAGKVGLIETKVRNDWPRTDVIPFESEHRLMATLNHDHYSHQIVFVKGATDTILPRCSHQRSGDGNSDLIDINYWERFAEKIANSGQRVLAIAVKSIPSAKTVLKFNDVGADLIMLGLVGFIDPPRPEAIQAVAECHSAGIRVKMITGDHVGTAKAIAKQIGLKNTEKVLTGNDLERMNDAALAAAVIETDVFARTNPENKLRLVMALQAQGLIVAMTGDGVNDAPALRRADAGVAMGKKGSDIAKEASELVLVDDNFVSIVAAVKEGRTVYDNLKKVISWTLPTNAGEAMTIVIALLFGMTLPVTPIQILWVNLITGITLGIALAFEPTEENTMRRPPRQRSEPLLTGALAWHICLVSILFICGVFGMYYYAVDRGYSIDLARTIAVNTLVVMEIFHLFFIRNIYGTSLTLKAVRGTSVVWYAVLIVTTGQFAITYIPVLQKMFGTQSVPILDGVIIVGVGVALFAICEIEKQIRLSGLKR